MMNKTHFLRWLLIAALVLTLFALCACGSRAAADSGAEAEPEPEHDIEAVRAAVKPIVPKVEYPGPDVELVDYDGVVEHLFFHPVVAYPELAFDGDNMSKGIDDWMLTVKEYDAILESLYKNGYIIVNIGDVWGEVSDTEEADAEGSDTEETGAAEADTEETGNEAGGKKSGGRDPHKQRKESGKHDPKHKQHRDGDANGGDTRMVRKKMRLPKGKKPLIISYDDVNYYEYMLTNGFTHKLIVRDGEVWSWGIDPQGKEVVSQDLDAITILDKFVAEHPDFSMYGTKGCIALTGYEGILGYRTQTTTQGLTAEQEQHRQEEIKAVRPVVDALKENGWYFGSHTWGHIDLSGHGVDGVAEDTTRWMNEVASIVGETPYLFYPHGARPDGDDVTGTGEVFRYLYDQGFRVFFSVGIESYSQIKDDIPAVIADRLHPDGTTLRWNRERYMRFYDAKDVFDYEYRLDYGRDF